MLLFKQFSGNVHKLLRPIIWLLCLGFTAGLVIFLYSNWFRVAVNPRPLDPALTQRRQTQILSSRYAEIQSLINLRLSAPAPTDVPDVFTASRSATE